MKLSTLKKLAREDMADAPAGAWIEQIISAFNQSVDQLTQALQNSLTLKDNTTSTYATFTMKDGVELRIKNPLKSRPVGIVPIRVSISGANSRQIISDFDWYFVGDESGEQIAMKVSYKTASTTSDVTVLFIGG